MEENKKRSIPETKVYKPEEQEGKEKAALIPKIGEIIHGTKEEIRELISMQSPANSLNVENMSKEDLQQNPLGLSEDTLRQFDRLLALEEEGKNGNVIRGVEGVEDLLKLAKTPEFLAYERYRKAEKEGLTKEEIQAMEKFIESMKAFDISEEEAGKIVYYLREYFASPLGQTLREYQQAVSMFLEKIASKGFIRLAMGSIIPYDKKDCVLLSRGGSLLMLMGAPGRKTTTNVMSYTPLPGRKDKNRPWIRSGKVVDQETMEKDQSVIDGLKKGRITKEDVKKNGRVGNPFYCVTNMGISNISAVEFAAFKDVIVDDDIKFVEKTFHESMDGLSKLPRTIAGD